MNTNEIASRLSREAADKLSELTIGEHGEKLPALDSLDIPSIQFGMRLARDANKLLLQALAQAQREMGRENVAQLLDKIAEDVGNLPIIGE